MESERATIRAAQVVYGNVEEEQSPRRISGFQTVCLTEENGLTWDFVREEIEPFIRYDPRGGCKDDALPPEYVFFPTSLASSRIVVGCISPAMTQTDRFGRPKVLFAHLLVFDRKQFREAFDNNPFCVIDNFRFFRTFQELLKSPDGAPQGCSNLPYRELPINYEVAGRSSQAFDQVQQQPDEFLHLLLLASSASQPKDRRPALELIVFPQQSSSEPIVLDFLRDLFRWIPRSQRAHCSFTTLFAARERKQRTSGLWANGVEWKECLDQPGVQRLDLGQCRFRDRQFAKRPFYENWLIHVFDQFREGTGALPCGAELQAAATLHDRCLPTERGLSDTDEIPDEVFEQFLAVNRKPLENLLQKNFKKFSGESLAAELAARALTWIAETGAESLRNVSRKFSSQQVCEWLLPKYENASRAPSRAELDAVIACADAPVPDSGTDFAGRLRLICHCWGKDLDEVARSISQLTPDDHQHVANWAMKTVDPIQAFTIATQNESRTCLWLECEVKESPPLVPALAGLIKSKNELVDHTQADFSQQTKPRAAVWSRLLNALGSRNVSQKPVHIQRSSDMSIETTSLPAVDVRVDHIQWLRHGTVDSVGRSPNVTDEHWSAVRDLVECVPSRKSPAYVYCHIPELRQAIVAKVSNLTCYGAADGFFAHVLFIDDEPFKESFQNNPFAVFSLHKFVEPSANWRSRHGNYPLETYRLHSNVRKAASESSIQAMARVMANPELLEWWFHIEGSRRCVDLVGSNEQVYSLLEALFVLFPPDVRLRCDFHTRCVTIEDQQLSTRKAASHIRIVGMPRQCLKPSDSRLQIELSSASPLTATEVIRGFIPWIEQRPNWTMPQRVLNELGVLLQESAATCGTSDWHFLKAMYGRLEGNLSWDDLAKSAFALDLGEFERLTRWCLATLKPDSFRIVEWHATSEGSNFLFGPEIELRDRGESGSEAGEVLAALANCRFMLGECKLTYIYADPKRRIKQWAVLWNALAERTYAEKPCVT